MIKDAIVKIVNKEDLTYDEAFTVMNEIMSGQTTPTQNAAFLAALTAASVSAAVWVLPSSLSSRSEPLCAPTERRFMPLFIAVFIVAV